MIAALEEHDHDIVATARALGMSRATFYRRLKELDISRVNPRRIRIAF